jgi:hypothetical protein
MLCKQKALSSNPSTPQKRAKFKDTEEGLEVKLKWLCQYCQKDIEG